jgi:hypothetical protein
MQPKFVKLTETMIVNVAHVASVEWEGVNLVVQMATPGGYMAIPGASRFVCLQGDEAKAAWETIRAAVGA